MLVFELGVMLRVLFGDIRESGIHLKYCAKKFSIKTENATIETGKKDRKNASS